MGEPPIASRPHIPGYGIPRTEKGLLDWSFAVERLERSKHYWLATTSPGHKPHVTAVWGAWVDGALYFGGGPEVRWAKNLRSDPRIVVHLEPADQVIIIEGSAEVTTDEGEAEVLAVQDAYEEKYDLRHPPPFWRVRPVLAFGWTDLSKDATRWTF
jgi:nitroimidazol reductase NimA-like FMN-containing flavoprotein (pyridoxamine 5'-phosphate oxidase superfamily)